jgi:hypothetical protein
MHQTNPTEMFRERQLALVREAEDRRLARGLRAAHSKRSPRNDQRMAGFRRAIAFGGRTMIPFLGLRGSQALRGPGGAR